MPSPNSNAMTDIASWIKFYDIYQTDVFPHLLEFDSWSDAVNIVRTVDLSSVSENMRSHNVAEFHRIGNLWKSVFNNIIRSKTGIESGRYSESVDDALRQSYGLGPLGRDVQPKCHTRKKQRATTKINEIKYNPGSKCVNSLSSTNEQDHTPFALQNLLVHGSYLEACEQPSFDPELNILSCKIGNKILTLFDPFSCFEDISVNPYKELQC